jgi:hypothetical protein
VALRLNFKLRSLLIGAVVLAAVASGLLVYLGTRPGTPSAGTDAQGLPLSTVTASFIEGRLDAHLTYPGATVFKTVLHGARPSIYPDDVAYAEIFMATNDAPLVVRDWYLHALHREGYHCSGNPGIPDYMYLAEQYYRGPRESFLVGYVNPHFLELTYDIQIPNGQLIFEVDYFVIPSGHSNSVSGEEGCFKPFPSPYPSPTP